MRRTLGVLILAILASGCTAARGFDRGALSRSLAPATPATEEEIQRVFDLKPQLPHPFKLGVFFRAESGDPYPRVIWQWQPDDKQRLLEVGQALERRGVITEAVFISPETSSGQDLKAIRLAAARHGVDAVLVVSGVADVDRYNNSLGPTYALIVTPFFVPGTVVDALFLAHAALWDVRNEFLYASMESDGRASQTVPAVMVQEDSVVAQGKQAAIAQLAESVERHIQNLSQ